MTERTCIDCGTDITFRHSRSTRCKSCQGDARILNMASGGRADRARRLAAAPPTMMRCHLCLGTWDSENIISHMQGRHDIPSDRLRLSLRKDTATWPQHTLTVRQTQGVVADTLQ